MSCLSLDPETAVQECKSGSFARNSYIFSLWGTLPKFSTKIKQLEDFLRRIKSDPRGTILGPSPAESVLSNINKILEMIVLSDDQDSENEEEVDEQIQTSCIRVESAQTQIPVKNESTLESLFRTLSNTLSKKSQNLLKSLNLSKSKSTLEEVDNSNNSLKYSQTENVIIEPDLAEFPSECRNSKISQKAQLQEFNNSESLQSKKSIHSGENKKILCDAAAGDSLMTILQKTSFQTDSFKINPHVENEEFIENQLEIVEKDIESIHSIISDILLNQKLVQNSSKEKQLLSESEKNGSQSESKSNPALLEVRYAVAVLQKFEKFTIVQILKSTNCVPDNLPDSLENIFVVKQ